MTRMSRRTFLYTGASALAAATVWGMYRLETDEAPMAPSAASTSTSTTLSATSNPNPATAPLPSSISPKWTLAAWAGPNTLKNESRKVMQAAANHGIELFFDFFADVARAHKWHAQPVEILGP